MWKSQNIFVNINKKKNSLQHYNYRYQYHNNNITKHSSKRQRYSIWNRNFINHLNLSTTWCRNVKKNLKKNYVYKIYIYSDRINN